MDLGDTRLDGYKPPELEIHCARCKRHATAMTITLVKRYGVAARLDDVARRVAAEGNPPCLLAAGGDRSMCGAIPIEPPVTSWARLEDALKGGWVAVLHCGRRHAALKAASACDPIDLDVRSLVASFGFGQELSRLPSKMRCPGCNSSMLSIEWLVPPEAPPPELVADRPAALHRPVRPLKARGLRVVGGREG